MYRLGWHSQTQFRPNLSELILCVCVFLSQIKEVNKLNSNTNHTRFDKNEYVIVVAIYNRNQVVSIDICILMSYIICQYSILKLFVLAHDRTLASNSFNTTVCVWLVWFVFFLFLPCLCSTFGTADVVISLLCPCSARFWQCYYYIVALSSVLVSFYTRLIDSNGRRCHSRRFVSLTHTPNMLCLLLQISCCCCLLFRLKREQPNVIN